MRQPARLWMTVAAAGLAAGLGACGSVRTSSGAGTGVSSVRASPLSSSRAGANTSAHATEVSGGTLPSTEARTTTSSPSSSTTTVSLPGNHEGTPLAVTGPSGEAATVTLQQIVAPAAPLYAFATPPAGQEYAAVQLRVTNTGVAVLTDDAQADTTIRVAGGETYHAVVVDVNGCTGFVGGLFTLAPGTSAVGCVSFEVPVATTVVSVTFGLGGSTATSEAEWRVP